MADDADVGEQLQCIGSKGCGQWFQASFFDPGANKGKRGDGSRMLCPDCYERHVARLNAYDHRQRQAIKRCAYMQAERDAVREVYFEAGRLSQKFGIPYHVEHQVPRTGKRNGKHVVTGLHVSVNVRIAPADMNLAKGSNIDTAKIERYMMAWLKEHNLALQ
jgi:hypothetical protein